MFACRMQSNVCPVQMPRWAYLLIVGVVAVVTAALRVAFFVDALWLSWLHEAQTRAQARTERDEIFREANALRLTELVGNDAPGRARVAPAPPEAEPDVDSDSGSAQPSEPRPEVSEIGP